METETSNTTTPTGTGPPAVPPVPECQNCGAPLYGKFCYACGQPVHGLVRHFSSILGDVADSLFNLDARLFRTIGPLYLRPGRLTLDYFEGKRARYVTPFRLVFFLAIIAFFAIQVSVRSRFSEIMPVPASAAAGATATAPAPANGSFTAGDIRLDNGWVWNRSTHPLRLAWLPTAGNEWLNDLVANAQQQIHAMTNGSGAERVDASRKFTLRMVSTAPTVLFVLLPFFALLLKLFYIFKRRLYMEHLIVAMHSHAFLMLSMLALLVLGALRAWLLPRSVWLGTPVALAEGAAWIWLFVYLLVMQKRVYRQGWTMTAVKFWCVGWCYFWLVLVGIVFAALLSLTSA